MIVWPGINPVLVLSLWSASLQGIELSEVGCLKKCTLKDTYTSLGCELISWMEKLKVLANEDTLLRTHYCWHKCFPLCPSAQHLLRTQTLCPGHKKCSWFCSETFCVRNKCFPVCAAQETSWATMCPQQCVLVYQGLNSNMMPYIFSLYNLKWHSA